MRHSSGAWRSSTVTSSATTTTHPPLPPDDTHARIQSLTATLRRRRHSEHRTRGNLSYTVDLNAFSDMLQDELVERFTPFEEYGGTEEERTLDPDEFPLMGGARRR